MGGEGSILPAPAERQLHVGAAPAACPAIVRPAADRADYPAATADGGGVSSLRRRGHVVPVIVVYAPPLCLPRRVPLRVLQGREDSEGFQASQPGGGLSGLSGPGADAAREQPRRSDHHLGPSRDELRRGQIPHDRDGGGEVLELDGAVPNGHFGLACPVRVRYVSGTCQ